MVPFANSMFDLVSLLEGAGYVGLAGIIFAETGLLIGFFLPGDSLLLTAGILASQGFFNIWILVSITTLSAILGDSVGYWSGKKAGPMIFTRPDSFFFSHERVEEAERFFNRYGAVSIILARFVPVARTFTPLLAGVGKMNYRTFVTYNVVGAFLWAFLLPMVGYYLGSRFPEIHNYILPLIVVVVLISVVPAFVEIIKRRSP